jgi:Tfp pilus assembly protein PilV
VKTRDAAHRQAIGFARRAGADGQAGFAMLEVLVAILLIMVGLTAVMGAFPIGIVSADIARRQSTAVFLADQKIEQIKSWSSSAASGQGFASITNGNPATAACCQAEGYNTIPGYGRYRRQVNVSGGPTANTKYVQVQVFYRRVNSPTETQAQLATLLVAD